MLKKIQAVLLFPLILIINCSCAMAANTNRTLPADIDLESLSRLPMIHKHDLDPEGQRVFEMIMGTDTDTPNIGPAAVSLYNPKVAEAMQMLNQEVRYRSVIGRRYTELAILVASREFDQQYEWSMHEDAAREEGVPDAVIDTIKYKRDVAVMSKEESLIIRFG
ncbi:MAG: pcaC 2, partial [Gammaproteobacteria bacterium]|nr:pcaC 2 [Gammaproteobacteria bacterium]